MKDTRFIELVNLYVDRQISPEETAELETEIQASPRRRRIYQQYCHLHRATRLVYESFRANVDQPSDGAAKPGSIAYFAQRRQRVRRTFWLSTAGGLAAAACLALYFVRADLNPINQAGPSAAARVVVVAPNVPAPATAANAVKSAAAQPDYSALLAAMRQTNQRTFAINPSPSVRPVSLFDDGVFDGKQGLAPDDRSVFQTKGKPDTRTPAEFTAFQFQR